MKDNYKRTFDAVNLSAESQAEIRSALSSRFTKKEKIIMKKKLKSTRILVIVAAIVLSLAFVGFNYGDKIIDLLGGGNFKMGRGENGASYVSMSTGFDEEPVEIRDNQVFFILDGSNTNITDQCSDETYYQYESKDANGNRHVVLVGGTPDNIGWAEFVWDKGEKNSGSNATFSGEEEGAEPKWLTAGRAALGEQRPK